MSTTLEPMGARRAVGELRRNAPFVRFWTASTVSDFGTYITTVALAVLVLVTLGGSAQDQGWVSAARWAPYLLFGLVAGIWVDHFSRTTVLVAADLGRGILLGLLCIGGVAGWLNVPLVVVAIFAFGMLSMLGDAADRSLLTQLVTRPLLVKANARLQQSDTVAQTVGGAIAGGLVAALSAPFALLLDAASFLFSGAIMASLPRRRPLRNTGAGPTLSARIGESLRWVYGHRFIGPMAWSTHVWFIGSAMLGTVLPVLVLHDAGLGAVALGLVLSCAGVGSVIGTGISLRAGQRWGTGPVMVVARGFEALSVVLLAIVAGAVPGWHEAGVPPGLVVGCIGAAQLVWGIALGTGSPLEMGFQQAVTPDAMIARMSSVIRSANRGMIVIGAPVGGLIATVAGVAVALWVAAGFICLGLVLLAASPFRTARIEDEMLDDEAAAG